MVVDYTDYLEAGWHIFPLHAIIDGKCGCGNPECPPKSLGKHPILHGWQHVTTWDEDQLDYMTGEDSIGERNQFLDGFGVNLLGLHILVVDVDVRNGGLEGLKKLNHTLGYDIEEKAAFVVNTGSGDGSRHIYMYVPDAYRGKSLAQTLSSQFEGIDFKSTGFVVGCGSNHASGEHYWAKKGTPADVIDAPVELMELIVQKEKLRSTFSGTFAEYSFAELRDIVLAIQNKGRDYEKWIRIGMGVHHATDGSAEGYDLWCEWSAKSDAHDPDGMDYKWHSFGKSRQSQVTIATLKMWAEEDGYVVPVTFDAGDQFEDVVIDVPETVNGVTSKVAMSACNLKQPPGLAGDIVAWINSRSMYPRENLAVAAALMAISNAAGLRYRVGGYNTSLNLIVFGVADSGSGKGAILSAMQELDRAAGVQDAVHGGIKSEQELIRNQLRNQAAIYKVDEAGSFLNKISNSKKSGRTAYLEHVVGVIMSLFSNANDYYNITGDLKEELREGIEKERARITKRMDDGVAGLEHILDDLTKELEDIREGIKEPYMSFFGLSEPSSFNEAVNGDVWLTIGGLIGRSLVFTETNGVPHRKKLGEFGSFELPMNISMQLAALYWGGKSGEESTRVKRHGDIVQIPMTDKAKEAEEEIYEYWHKQGVLEQDMGTGMQTLTIRATELTLKVAGILGVAGGQITVEHMQWAHALVHRITHEKMSRAKAATGAESKETQDRSDGLIEAVKSVLIQKDAFTVGVIANRFRRDYTKKQVQECLDWMVSQGMAKLETKVSANNRKFDYYSAVDK